MTAPPMLLWRAFPWQPEARSGQPFSPGYVPAIQGKGRFDLPGSPGGVLYLAETPEHAVAESIQHLRGQRLDDSDLLVQGRRLALVAGQVPGVLREAIADLCDPAVLLEMGVRPDETASRERRITQAIAAAVRAGGRPGLRWWSVFSGDWHTVVIFRGSAEDVGEPVAYQQPEALSLEHGTVRDAARALGIRT